MLNTIFSRMLAALALLLWVTTAQANNVVEDEATRHELRTLVQNVEKAVNAQQYEQLSQYFDPKMHVTPSNQEVLTSQDQIQPYFDKWFGPKRFLKSIQMTLTADRPTELNPAKDFGVTFGSGIEKYVLTDGRRYDIPTRWTASVSKGADGKWRIMTLHIGANFVDNPLFNEAKAALWRFASIGAGVGLAVGLILGWLIKRRKLAKQRIS